MTPTVTIAVTANILKAFKIASVELGRGHPTMTVGGDQMKVNGLALKWKYRKGRGANPFEPAPL
jgi:hypothetical protein